MQQICEGAVPTAQQILNKYLFINFIEYYHKYLFNSLDLCSNTHLAQDRRFPSAWQRSVLPRQRGERICLHIPVSQIKCPVPYPIRNSGTPLDHQHPSHTFHLDPSSILVPKWALAAPSPPQHQHQGPPRGSSTPKCHPEGIPGSGYPRLCPDLHRVEKTMK